MTRLARLACPVVILAALFSTPAQAQFGGMDCLCFAANARCDRRAPKTIHNSKIISAPRISVTS
jgi:hypothetical protein